MSKSPVYIGAGSDALTAASAQNIIDNASDISLQLQTVEEWVTLTDGTTVFDFVDNAQTTDYSAKEYAQGSTLAAGGSAKNWAQLLTTPTTTATDASAKEWAAGISTHKAEGSAKDWAIYTTGDVRGASAGSMSAKEWAVGVLGRGVSGEGSAKDWATRVENSTVDNAGYSALHWAAKATTTYDNFDDRYLGTHTTAEREVGAENIGKNHDGDALVDGALYFDTTLDVMKVWNVTGSIWKQIIPTSGQQTNIDAAVADATDIGVVAGKATEIGRLGTADAVADMVLLGTSDCVADMAILATTDIVADLAILGTADVVTDMNVLGTADVVVDMNVLATADVVTDMNTLGTADVVTDMNTLGTADVVADMNTLGTGGNVTNMNTLAGIATNITTVAGVSANVTTVAGVSGNVTTVATNISSVNDFADKYRIAGSAPGSDNDDGDLYYNTTTNQLNVHDGSNWGAIGLTQVQTQAEASNAAVAMSIALG